MIEAVFKSGINDLTTDGAYQWDYNQYIAISGINFSNIAPNVHFANKKSNNAIVMQSFFENGKVVCQIPNSLLTERYDILAYIYVSEGLSAKTIKTIRIPITARAEPSAGMATPSDDEIHEIAEIELQAKLILDGLTISDYSSTATYRKPNMVFWNNATYMCISDTNISGINPTNASKWKMMCYGSEITRIDIDANGNLAFDITGNHTFTIPFQAVDVSTTDVVSKALTADKATLAENLNTRICGSATVNAKAVFVIPSNGLYLVTYRHDYDASTSTTFINIRNGDVSLNHAVLTRNYDGLTLDTLTYRNGVAFDANGNSINLGNLMGKGALYKASLDGYVTVTEVSRILNY